MLAQVLRARLAWCCGRLQVLLCEQYKAFLSVSRGRGFSALSWQPCRGDRPTPLRTPTARRLDRSTGLMPFIQVDGGCTGVPRTHWERPRSCWRKCFLVPGIVRTPASILLAWAMSQEQQHGPRNEREHSWLLKTLVFSSSARTGGCSSRCTF